MEKFIQKEKIVKDKKFDKIANKFLNKTILKINNSEFRIVEIEFYLKNQDHKDDYTHGNDDQLKYGNWYFHKFANGSYKSGTFKGLDLTLGNKKSNSYCGILIRSIYDIKNKELIQGPCNCVNKILSKYKKTEIKDFTREKLLSATNNNRNFILENKKLEKEKIFKGPRVGLSEKYPKFKTKKYRYLIFKDKIKKQKKDLEKI